MENHSLSLQEINATVAFSGESCMICINAQPVKMTFSYNGENIVSSSGQLIKIPHQTGDPSSEDTRAKIHGLFEKNPDSVFIAEFGPGGPVAEHAITVIPSKKKIAHGPL